MTHICVSKLTIIGSDNCLSSARRQAIIWTSADLIVNWSIKNKIQCDINQNFEHFTEFTLLVLKSECSSRTRPILLLLIPWLPYQAINRHSIDSVGWRNQCLPWGRILATYIISVSRSDRKAKYIFMFRKHSAWRGLSWTLLVISAMVGQSALESFQDCVSILEESLVRSNMTANSPDSTFNASVIQI